MSAGVCNDVALSTPKDLDQRLAALGGQLGWRIRAERRRRGWSLRALAARAGTSASLVRWVETGRIPSVETYLRLADALALRVEIDLVDPRRAKGSARSEDPVHSGMGEWFARRLAMHHLPIAFDEPYQHYQFAGRADLLTWSLDPPALLQIENRTRFPNVQEAVGSYNAKRRYLPAVLAERLGIRGGLRSVTNVMAVLWSAEALHDLRLRSATFAATCPDAPDELLGWLDGRPPDAQGLTSTLVVIDPTATARSRSLIGLADVAAARPRFRGYADALAAFKDAGLC
jgi:transcriptional regulator with XRE-family HTH domain